MSPDVRMCRPVRLTSHMQDLLRGFPQARHLSQLRQKLNCSLPGASRDEGQNADDNFDDDKDDDNYYPRKKKPEPWEWSNWEENWNRIMRPLLLHDVASEAAL